MTAAPDYKGPILPAMIAAAPGTNIVDLVDGVVIRMTVIAWAPDAENIYRAPHPITCHGIARMVGNRAVEHPNGLIDDAGNPVSFANEDEWLSWLRAGKHGATRRSHTVSPERAEPPKAPKAASAAAMAGALKIEWMTKPFQTNSFYRYTDGDIDFIFDVPGGVNPPKQKAPVVKIKRDEFVVMKKTMDVASVTDLQEGRYPGMVDLGEDFEAEDEDDDAAASLI